MIAPGLRRTGRRTRVACTGAGCITDLGGAAKFTRDYHEHTVIESTRINIFNERGNCLVVDGAAEFHGIENMLIHGVVVPVLHTAAKRAAQAGGYHIDSRFNKATGQKQLLAPCVAAVPITHACILTAEVKRDLRLRICEKRHGLRLEFVECCQFTGMVEAAFQSVKLLPQG